jgi:hypothetical protein
VHTRSDERGATAAHPEQAAAPAHAQHGRPRLDRSGVLALQRTIGNAAVGKLFRQVAGPLADVIPDVGSNTWTKAEIKAIQRELRRMRLYDKGLDGIIGFYSEQGLVEAFGGDEWRTLGPATALTRLKDATRPAVKGGGRSFRYAELFKDGVLDVTIGVGYMEEMGGTYVGNLEGQFATVLDGRGFKEDAKLGTEIMEKSGRKLGKTPFGRFFVKRNAFIYAPPAGKARPIHVVVRLVVNAKGDKGAEALGAFREGFTQGDVAYYSGHGRYGSGPDFDRNFAKFTLLDKPRAEGGKPTDVLTDYHLLEDALKREGNPWRAFLRRVSEQRIEVDLSNAGNLRFSEKNMHAGEFGANLIHWAMDRSGTKAETGTGGRLEKETTAHPERKYRLLVFEACRTGEYEKALRSTQGFSSKDTDLIGTKRSIGFLAETAAFMAFLDGVIAQKASAGVVRDMNKQMAEHEAHYTTDPFVATGMGDNPRR